jgi:hypothetical protein
VKHHRVGNVLACNLRLIGRWKIKKNEKKLTFIEV